MTDINSLLNEADDADKLEKALVEGHIEYARRLVEESLPKEIWDLLNISRETTRSKINSYSLPDLADYSLQGSFESDDEQFQSLIQVIIDNNYAPGAIFASVLQSNKKIGYEPAKKLVVPTDLKNDNTSVQKENRSKIVAMLSDAQKWLQKQNSNN
jgi:hypothetical protein